MTRRCGKGKVKRKTPRAVGCRGCSLASTLSRFIVSRSLFLQPFPPCSPSALSPPSSSLSSSLFLFTDLFRLFLAAPDIFTASCRRVDLVCITPLLLSGPACRSSSKTVSPPRFMFPPTQQRIDPFLLSDVYVCGSVFLPRSSLSRPAVSFPLMAHARARITRAHDRLSPLVTQSMVFPLSPCFGFFRNFFSAVLSSSSRPSSAPPLLLFLPLTAFIDS